jgi:hypothetical protein
MATLDAVDVGDHACLVSADARLAAACTRAFVADAALFGDKADDPRSGPDPHRPHRRHHHPAAHLSRPRLGLNDRSTCRFSPSMPAFGRISG